MNHRSAWCASCRKTYATEDEAARCPCGRAIAAQRAEYVLTVHEVERGRSVPCRRCGAPMLFTLSEKGKRVPLSRAAARRVPCPFCATQERVACFCGGRRELFLVLSHFVDCPEADSFRLP